MRPQIFQPFGLDGRRWLRATTKWRCAGGATRSPFHVDLEVPLKFGKCFDARVYLQAKPSRLHCSHCDETYSLPQNGAIKLYKELRCPLDDFELVLWTSGARGKSYPLCPYCFSNPPFRDMKKGRSGL